MLIIEKLIRLIIIYITNWLPVKVIRDDNGRPFLFRYHIFSLTNNGPGLCIHHFVKSDPDRGYHSHPWNHSLSFILCGSYNERIFNIETNSYTTVKRNRWNFNYLTGDIFHRVMLDENTDAWTIFFFQKRSKIWEMIGLDNIRKPMSLQIEDTDGGWWNHVQKGIYLHIRNKFKTDVVATVDNIILCKNKLLLIKRFKQPFKDYWALPGGRINPDDITITSAAYRELKEETNITDIKLEFYKNIGNPTRDPRGFGLSVVFIGRASFIPKNIKAGDDACDYKWFDVNNLPDMAFDHKSLVLDALLETNQKKLI